MQFQDLKGQMSRLHNTEHQRLVKLTMLCDGALKSLKAKHAKVHSHQSSLELRTFCPLDVLRSGRFFSPNDYGCMARFAVCSFPSFLGALARGNRRGHWSICQEIVTYGHAYFFNSQRRCLRSSSFPPFFLFFVCPSVRLCCPFVRRFLVGRTSRQKNV